MAAIFRLLSASLVLLCISSAAFAQGQCDLSSISVVQSKTGNAVQGKPQYQVTVGNGCICSQSNLQLDCTGFQTVQPISPAVLSYDGHDRCTVNAGQPLQQGDNVKFQYAWDSQFDLKPVSSSIGCS